MTQPQIIVVWFRQDLRLSDLPALEAAASAGAQVVPLYIFDERDPWALGGASRWWLHHSLAALASSIAERGGELILRSGNAEEQLKDVCESVGATTVHCSRRYEPASAALEQTLHKSLDSSGIRLRRFPGSLLHEPGSVLTGGGLPYKVFTPFWRACRRQAVPSPVSSTEVDWLRGAPSEELGDWNLLPSKPDWASGWTKIWTPGEAGAQARLEKFLGGDVAQYGKNRDLPAVEGTSRLSPHLHFGEISPRQVWWRCEAHVQNAGAATAGIEKFQSELGWREFSYHLLHYFPHIPEAPFNERFGVFPWQSNREHLLAWQRGQTGYPIVDAGMRELWETGYMHNRVRMIVASFLCKHLRIDWRQGEAWFWDTLVDADLASNSCSWQWVAGSGADAAPYFRIFNPMTQGEKFDKQGEYVRRWVPELSAVPDKYLHQPWEAPDEILEAAGVELGATYPQPIVDHREARAEALGAYEVVKASAATA